MGGHGGDIANEFSISRHVLDTKADYVFAVSIAGGHKFTVWFAEDYYRNLTDGKMDTDTFIKKTFDFLVAKDALKAVKADLDLSTIQAQFPDYESTISGAGAPAPQPSPVATPPVATPAAASPAVTPSVATPPAVASPVATPSAPNPPQPTPPPASPTPTPPPALPPQSH